MRRADIVIPTATFFLRCVVRQGCLSNLQNLPCPAILHSRAHLQPSSPFCTVPYQLLAQFRLPLRSTPVGVPTGVVDSACRRQEQ